MAATVAGELAVPRLLARFGYRALLAAGWSCSGRRPCPARLDHHGRDPGRQPVRGLGFAIVWWSAGRWWPLVPGERRGEGLGLFGIVVGVPGVAALPLGVWLVGWPATRRCSPPGRRRRWPGWSWSVGCPAGRRPRRRPSGVLAGLRTPALVRPAVTFSVTAMAAGVVVTFLPLAVTGGREPGRGGAVRPGGGVHGHRWWAGRYGDRHGPAVLLVPGVVAAAAACGPGPDRPPGGGPGRDGAVRVRRGHPDRQHDPDAEPGGALGVGTVSAIWNLAYDPGIGAGAFGFGVVAARTGYPAAFAATAALVLAALVPLALDRAGRDGPGLYTGCPEGPGVGLQRVCCIQPVCRARRRRRTRPSGTGSSAGSSGGGRLREEELAGSIGVSRTPVRRRCGGSTPRGWSSSRPTGARVASWSDQDLDEIFGLRAVLESYGASLAATRVAPEALAGLAGLADAMEGPAAAASSTGGRAQQPLPRGVLAASGNQRLVGLLSGVVVVSLVRRTFHRYSPEALARSHAHHRELLAALAAGDPEWAASVMRSHVLAARAVLR